MRKLILIIPIILLSGCARRVSPETAEEIRNKHAESYVFAQRLNDQDQQKRPTDAQKDMFIKAAAKDYESFDREVNNWQPSSGMKTLDLNGKPNDK